MLSRFTPIVVWPGAHAQTGGAIWQSSEPEQIGDFPDAQVLSIDLNRPATLEIMIKRRENALQVIIPPMPFGRRGLGAIPVGTRAIRKTQWCDYRGFDQRFRTTTGQSRQLFSECNWVLERWSDSKLRLRLWNRFEWNIIFLIIHHRCQCI